jgi:hypothetical protein
MTGNLMQCERVFGEGGAQSFRADNIHVRMSQPDLFDYRWYIENLSSVFSGPELRLQMLCDLQI